MALIDFHMSKQLHIWDKPNLAMVYCLSYVVLDPVDQPIVEHFVHLSWPIVALPCDDFIQFDIQYWLCRMSWEVFPLSLIFWYSV